MLIPIFRDPDYLEYIKRDDTPPVNFDDPGTAGDMAYDASYLYVCIAADTWRRVDISSWGVALEAGNPIGLLLTLTYAG